MTAMRWVGIPYARAARFAAPELLDFDPAARCDAFGPAAPQPVDSPLESVVPGMSVRDQDERECLTLNIWAPDAPGPHPVLVWFPGGSFVIGASAQPVYDGAVLAAEQSVVVVTVNYRLGVLGFVDARPLGGVANCGLRDALCALTWIQRHIAHFGGDPDRVVAFGESAGGGLVLHAFASPLSEGLLAGAIVQSGATFSTLDEARASVVLDAVRQEIEGADLTTLSVDALVTAQTRAMSSLLGTIGMMPFHPMIDGDVLEKRPADALVNSAPLIVGTTADEMALFVDGQAIERERLERRVRRYLRVDDAQAGAIVDAYAMSIGTHDTAALWLALFSDMEMQAPARAMLEAHAPHGPTFSYLFTWAGPSVRSCHAIDLPFTFGNFVDGWDAFVGMDDDALALSARMRNAWAQFARTGEPGWPGYPSTMVFGRDSAVSSSHPLFARIPAARIG